MASQCGAPEAFFFLKMTACIATSLSLLYLVSHTQIAWLPRLDVEGGDASASGAPPPSAWQRHAELAGDADTSRGEPEDCGAFSRIPGAW